VKKILLKDVNDNDGVFINLDNNKSLNLKNEIHISYDDLLINHKELLDKSKRYYIYCKGGIKSKKAVNILEFYGYDVFLVYRQ
jgi:rhodanese-related sulfurtransferase